MASKDTSRVITTLSVAIGIYFVAVVLPKFIISEPVPTLMTTQGLELFLSLVAIAILGKGKFSRYGFCLPKGGARWMLIAAAAPLLGMAATIAVLALNGSGSPTAKHLSFPQIILFVWVLSSIIEEVFTRGFLQGHLSVLSGKYARFGFFRIELPVLISAVFFACMHLVLPFVGADAVTTVVIFLFTLSLGIMTGILRASTGSLIPAIAAHAMANIGGLIGGIIYTALTLLTGGKLPGP